ncbi:DUF4214 domain-containing protein [Extensimonas perlucida]|uniref:DUF4214 domain-containing protein n=1 Tax=Extensimonas perlucida TaxID=2590786 RepID=UPI0011AA4786|nr:DUF4214 domain-containing protein [Extensimonas perlucida]
MALTTAQIQQAYVTFFSRPADVAGLNYWSQYPGSIDNLYATFAQSAEYAAAFNGLTNSQKVSMVYQNLFSRAADAPGLSYWTLELDRGAVTVANLALALANGAQGSDIEVIANRVTAATSFTSQLDTTPEILAYSGDNANAIAKAWLANVTDAASLATATTTGALDAVVQSVVSGGGLPGQTFTLTANQDILTGTTGNDTFDAPLLGAAGATGTSYSLTLGDNLNGGGGTDTLNASVGGTVANFAMTSIENVYLTPVAAATVANTMTGVQQLWMKDALGDLDVTGISRALTIGVENAANVTFTANYADVAANSAIDQVVVLNGAAGDTGVSIDLGTYTTAAFKSLTVNAQGVASENITLVGDVLTDATALTINATADLAFATGAMTMAAVTTATFTGDGAIDLGGIALGSTGGTAALTINATAASAGLTVQLGNTGTAQLTANFGAGDDSLDIDARTSVTGTVAVNMGAGDDTVSIGQALLPTSVTNVSIVGGDGVDTLSVADVNNAANVTAMKFGNVSGFEELSFGTTVALAGTAATLDLTGEGMNTVVFEKGFTASATGALTIKGLASNATIEVVGTDADVLGGLSLDNAGSATLKFTDADATGASVQGALTLSNATSLVFDINDTSTDGTGAVNATVSLADIIASKVVTLSFTGGEYDATVSTSIDTLILNLSGATFGTATTDSNLDALTTIDLSGFNGSAVLDLDAATGVQKNKLTIKLGDGSAVADTYGTAAPTTDFVTLTLTDKSDTIVFASDLKASVDITDFTAGLGGDLLNVAALGITSISQLDIAYSSGSALITSDEFDGQIEVAFIGSATTFTVDNFIFA